MVNEELIDEVYDLLLERLGTKIVPGDAEMLAREILGIVAKFLLQELR